jgi:hypothetical protein
MQRALKTFQHRRVLDAEAVSITCEDCGREKTWDRPTLRGIVPPETTFNQFGRRLVCASCRLRGGDGGNVSLRPVWSLAGR